MEFRERLLMGQVQFGGGLFLLEPDAQRFFSDHAGLTFNQKCWLVVIDAVFYFICPAIRFPWISPENVLRVVHITQQQLYYLRFVTQ